jgi:hypothetical protein
MNVSLQCRNGRQNQADGVLVKYGIVLRCVCYPIGVSKGRHPIQIQNNSGRRQGLAGPLCGRLSVR